MTHDRIYKIFEEMLPSYRVRATQWFQNGKNSIRVRIEGCDYIFTYNNPSDWKFETVESFLRGMKK